MRTPWSLIPRSPLVFVFLGASFLAIPSFTQGASFNVFADTDSAYVGNCLARYEGFHAVQLVGVTPADHRRPWALDATLRGGPCLSWRFTASTCEKSGVLPGTQFLACETQHDHTCINITGPFFWAWSSGGFTARPAAQSRSIHRGLSDLSWW